MRFITTLGAACAGLLATTAHAGGDVFDESIDGDLSTDPNAPTPVEFSVGSNLVSGTITSPADTRDYLTFTIGPGEALVALNLLTWEDLPGGGPGNTGFNGINSGETSFVPSGSTVGNFLGTNHILSSFEGTDLLPGLAAAPFGGMGFSTPLGPGTYTYLVQQTGAQLNGYSLDFVLTPSPGAAALLAVGAVGASRRRR